MTLVEYQTAVVEVHQEMRTALAVYEAIQVELRKAKDRLDAAEGKLRALARVEVKP